VLLSIAGLVSLVFGIVQGGDGDSWLSLGVLGPIVGGLAILAAFAAYEARIQHPSLDVRLFRDRRLSASVGALGLVFFGMGGVYFFTSFYLQNVRGYSPLDAGPADRAVRDRPAADAPRSARLVRRYGAKAVGATGMFVMGVAHRATPPSAPPRRSGCSGCCSASRARPSDSACRPPPPRSWTCCRASGPARAPR
jgi:hypothetical protein